MCITEDLGTCYRPPVRLAMVDYLDEMKLHMKIHLFRYSDLIERNVIFFTDLVHH